MNYENVFCCVDMLSLKNKNLCEKIRGRNVNISCLDDKNLKAKFYKCEIASLSFVLALLCKLSDSKHFSDFDEGFLSAESCLGEEEALELLDFLKNAKTIIIDENLKFHKDYESIKYFLNFLANKFNCEILDSNENKQDFSKAKFNDLKELDNYDGLVLFRTKLNDKFLHCSKQFLQIAKCQNHAKIIIEAKNLTLEKELFLDENLQGTIAFLDFENKSFDFMKIRVKEAK
ncbi:MULTISPECIES: hypothetical protein [unclassified Campylobacter]|uniref:hypothetical protein n=1 Tax=unclassified Campylobacter TaxID=2593542 RepID=UPI0012382B3E|nr:MULTISPECIES: hypothetical protein [unclassified Campylobacter]KAA6227274.1 hypothetical protein FMM57_04875 [Campylobacter sp. LR286c]KAA6227853.1 hypothetical protein FMM54_01605 [Campylobacter sp. LR185c]KAA6228261.1 hypothetical protein FMM55_01410 [Campylobacter sp. LR196d]KAA6229261.1 hypothetical protein FMM58_07840 [Campylobacter sp. LR291e]KAA6231067.1 hypothetical protein FMM56_05105 [Campylobacter sp. LR264d]